MEEVKAAQVQSPIDQVYHRLRETGDNLGLIFVEGLPKREVAWTWDNDDEPSEFIELAQRAGARLVYSDVPAFEVEEHVYDGLLDAMLIDEDDEEVSPLVGQVTGRFGSWQKHDLQSYRLAMVFVVDGVTHKLEIVADWFHAFSHELEQVIEELEEGWSSQNEVESRVKSDKQRQQAQELARSDRYARARNDRQREYVAAEMFPELDQIEVERLVELAGLIYWDVVEPEREREMAQLATSLKSDGTPVSTIAARLGVTKERVNRLLAIAESA